MHKDNIIEILGKLEIKEKQRIVQDTFDPKHFYVFIEINRSSNNSQVPSDKQLNAAKEIAGTQGYRIDYVLTDIKTQDIEAGLRSNLVHSFPEDVRNAFLSIIRNDGQVWIAAKREISKNIFRDIQRNIERFFEFYNIKLVGLSLTTDSNLPTKMVCIKTIRTLAPVSNDEIILRLQSLGFTVPSENWMNRMLDNLRKSNLLIRLQTGEYALSLTAIRLLGTSKNRNSPDISRLLALARRG